LFIVLPSNGIEVTEEENADIEDIISMGFSKEDSIEAFFTCDKNKEMAINYLFEAKENGTLLCKKLTIWFLFVYVRLNSSFLFEAEHINKEELDAAKEDSLHPN